MRGEKHSRTAMREPGTRPVGIALLPALVVLAALALLVAACGGDGNGPTHTPSATLPGGGNGRTPSAPPPTAGTISTPGAPEGIAGLCALPISVSAQPPGDIPSYPSAQLHIGSNQNGSGLFGYCSTASVSDVNSFFTAKIPQNGWQNVSSSAIGGTDQILATKGTTSLIITILTDSQVSGDTDIIIVTSATSG